MRAIDEETHQANRSPLWEVTQALVSDSQRTIAEAKATIAESRAARERMRSTVCASREALHQIEQRAQTVLMLNRVNDGQ